MMFKNKKLAHVFNNLNKKSNFKTLSLLKFKNNNFYHTESNKNNNNTIEAKPIISRTYYKDPFFLNQSNLRTQLQILRSLNKEKLDYYKRTISDSNKDTQPTLFDFKCQTINCFNSNSLLSEDFYYKSVFKMKPLFRRRKPVVDNKLNMRYAENEEQYKKIIEKEQKILLSQGKKIKNRNNSEHINIKMEEIKKRIRFMKGIIDFSFPGFVLTKIKTIDKRLKKENEFNHKLNKYYSPTELRNLNKNKRDNERKNYFYECINVKNNLK